MVASSLAAPPDAGEAAANLANNVDGGGGGGGGDFSSNPLGGGGRFAVESYLDFHGNKFTRRFDANSYLILVDAMNSHDVSRGRGSVAEALRSVKCESLVVGINSDRLFPLEDQTLIAENIGGKLIGEKLHVIDSHYGHDGFLIENEVVAGLLRLLFEG